MRRKFSRLSRLHRLHRFLPPLPRFFLAAIFGNVRFDEKQATWFDKPRRKVTDGGVSRWRLKNESEREKGERE